MIVNTLWCISQHPISERGAPTKCDTTPSKGLITPQKVYLGTPECCVTPNSNTPGVLNQVVIVDAPKGVVVTPIFNSVGLHPLLEASKIQLLVGYATSPCQYACATLFDGLGQIRM